MAVSNTLTSVIPTLFAQGLMSLRHNCVMPSLVRNDWANEVKQKGDTITIPVPSAVVTANVAPAAFAPDSGNTAPTTVTIPLSNWKEAAFTLTEKELAQVVDGIVPLELSSAVEALAFDVNTSIFNTFPGVYGYVGTATGTPNVTPFASDVTAATNARKVLAQQLAPQNNRRFVIDPTSEANALALAAFNAGYSSGDAAVMKEGQMGRKFGFDWHMDQQVPLFTAGTITTGAINKTSTAIAVGATTATATTAASTGAVALVAGDIILFANDSQTYTVTTAVTQASAATDFALAFSPGKVVAATGGEAITVKPGGHVNLAFHRDAFAFASRPLGRQNLTMDTDLTYMQVDPVSGLAMRLCIREEFHRTRLAFDILWGASLIRPQLAARVMGAI